MVNFTIGVIERAKSVTGSWLTPHPSPAACPPDIFPGMETWMRKRGDRVTITSGKYLGHKGVIESNVHQRTVDCPTELSDGFQVMLDIGVVVVRWDQVAAAL